MVGLNATIMMTILYIATEVTNSGGVSRTLSNKINYLVEVMGYDIHILSTNDNTLTPFFDFSSKITIHYCPIRINNIFSFFTFKKYLKSSVKNINPDWVVVTDNGIKGLFIKKWIPKNIPCIYELHADADYFINHSYKGLKKHINRFLINRKLPLFDKIVLLKEDYLPEFFPKEKQMIIPNPLPFQPKEHSKLNNNRAIAVGRIVPLKGYERMLKVWKEVVQIYNDYILDIYGISTREIDIEKLIKSYGLENNVFVHNPTKNINEKYLKADFLLHTSYFEAFPMVFIEAMSYGLPIICFQLKNQNLLTHNQNALIASNERELADFITLFIENRNLQQELTEGAITKAEEYRIDKIMQQWKMLFDKRLENN
ncbi:glycosyltransferase [Avrilella dinanensis]|uniref:glycosyltransferase n=1 Tax=Avrilella dinanensis TaxID=2008672 RepID=UPI00240A120C|nr:glycosyltransferase [Avrilella dinanensis]